MRMLLMVSFFSFFFLDLHISVLPPKLRLYRVSLRQAIFGDGILPCVCYTGMFCFLYETEFWKKREGRVSVSQITSYIFQLHFPRVPSLSRTLSLLPCKETLVSMNETLHNRFAHLTSYGPSNSSLGPSNWPSSCPNGTEQSPIDINTTTVMYDSNLGDFTLVNYDTTPAGVNFTATNKGKGLEISFDSHVYNVSGGGLTGTYTTVQFHLHWGSSNDKGSEHTVDGMMYPAEVCYV